MKFTFHCGFDKKGTIQILGHCLKMYWIKHFCFLGTILTVKSQLIYGLGLGYRLREPNKKIKADELVV